MALHLVDWNPKRSGKLDARRAPGNRITGVDKHDRFSLIDQVLDLRNGQGKSLGHQFTHYRDDDNTSLFAAVSSVKQPATRNCDECAKIGSRWVGLRTCQTCGVTRCCDSSPNRHASKHAQQSGHQAFASADSAAPAV